MVNESLVNWIKEAHAKGYGFDYLSDSLIKKGQDKSDVKKAIRKAKSNNSPWKIFLWIILGAIFGAVLLFMILLLLPENTGDGATVFISRFGSMFVALEGEWIEIATHKEFVLIGKGSGLLTIGEFTPDEHNLTSFEELSDPENYYLPILNENLEGEITDLEIKEIEIFDYHFVKYEFVKAFSDGRLKFLTLVSLDQGGNYYIILASSEIKDSKQQKEFDRMVESLEIYPSEVSKKELFYPTFSRFQTISFPILGYWEPIDSGTDLIIFTDGFGEIQLDEMLPEEHGFFSLREAGDVHLEYLRGSGSTNIKETEITLDGLPALRVDYIEKVESGVEFNIINVKIIDERGVLSQIEFSIQKGSPKYLELYEQIIPLITIDSSRNL